LDPRDTPKQVEADVGAPLFMRHATGLAPTVRALALAVQARVMASAGQAFVQSANGDPDQIEGTLHLGTSHVFAAELLPSVLASLIQSHPSLRFEIAASDHIEDLLTRL
jgi:DNA-binding transcriptional LysR family regulator